MISTLAVSNYRSLRDLVLPLGALTVITGANGSGKSNLYRALQLLADTARGGVVGSLAREGGLESVLWAGPETLSRAMRRGDHPVQGGPRRAAIRLQMGFAAEPFSYAIDLGMPKPSTSAFARDPEVKAETIWYGDAWRPASTLVRRRGAVAVSGSGDAARSLARALPATDSMLACLADPDRAPEVLAVREFVAGWRFYDQFRSDVQAPARRVQVGTRTPVLAADGADLPAAVQTIVEVGDHETLYRAVDDAFPGARVDVVVDAGQFTLRLHQPGLLRPLTQAELSDGTLRYLLLCAALLTPRPPPLLVLNEPETSLHPDLLPALARLIGRAAEQTQVWVVSHAARLVAALEALPGCHCLVLDRELGETRLPAQGRLDAPAWRWPPR